MRPDVDEYVRAEFRRREDLRRREEVAAAERADRLAARRQELLRRIEVPFAPLLEGRLLAAIVSDPAVLALCDAVESDDFGDLKHGIVFKALRNLQARGEWSVDDFAAALAAIGGELARTDTRDEKHEGDSVDDRFLAELLGRHMWETYGPPGAPVAAWVEHDARQLRLLAERRRAL